jgi:hypothetical protein
MKICFSLAAFAAIVAGNATAQNTFQITGTPIPQQLLSENYGSIARGIHGYDLNICNVTDGKQSLTSSKVYQALMDADATLQPVGRQIMLASILRNQNRSLSNVLALALSSATSALPLLSASPYGLPSRWSTAVALVSITGQQVLNNLKPVLSAGQLEKFETQVLEPALVMDGGSCVERTVFAISVAKPKAAKPQGLNFRVR